MSSNQGESSIIHTLTIRSSKEVLKTLQMSGPGAHTQINLTNCKSKPLERFFWLRLA